MQHRQPIIKIKSTVFPTLPITYICMFHIILPINSDFIPKWCTRVGYYNRDTVCLLQGSS
jgi:hypothetical protein